MYGLYVVKLKVKPPNLKMVPVLCQEISWIWIFAFSLS
jgi:hypothetical protein